MRRRGFLAAAGAAAVAQTPEKVIGSAAEALEVFDFVPVARKNVQSQHWAYLMGGSDDNSTVNANENGWSKWRIRARRHVDVSAVDLSVELFGQKLAHPVLAAPVAAHQAFHAEGEAATAKGAWSRKSQMILSTNASLNVRDVAKAYGGRLWFQLYSFSDFEVNRALLRNAEEAGCTAVTVTVDSVGGSPRIMQTRGGVKTEQRCRACHGTTQADYYKEHGNFDGIDMARNVGGPGRAVTWSVLDRIRAATKMKVLIKGVMTPEDAAECYRHGADGIVVSNHGGRAENSHYGTVDALPGIVEVVNGRMPVLIDGGIRRGVDVYKALALGATAVCVGRPYVWGLAAFGAEGVDKVFSMLQSDLRGIMQSCGATAIRHISPLSIERK